MNSIRLKFFDGQTVANTTIFSEKLDITNFSGASFHAVLTGAGIAGTIKIQASNDGANWVDVSGASSVIAGPSSHLFNISLMYHAFLRCAVISTNANVATCNGIAIGKE